MVRLQLFLLSIFLSCDIYCFAQFDERSYKERTAYLNFQRHFTDSIIRHGIPYDDIVLQKLQASIDSLNQTFPVYEHNRAYYSRQQAVAHYFFVDDPKINATAIRDIKHNIKFENFCKKYPQAEIRRNLLVVKSIYNSSVYIQSVSANKDFDYISIHTHSAIDTFNQLRGGWIYEIFSGGGFEGFYLPKGFSIIKIPEKYARMMAYADYMTSGSIPTYTSRAITTNRGFYIDSSNAVKSFTSYIAGVTNKPDITDNMKYKAWLSERFIKIDHLADKREFIRRFNIARSSIMMKGHTSEEMEDYIERYGSKADALQLKRGRRVWAGCGNDDAPRYHLYNIARLAAETSNRQLFLHIWLSIMGEPFDGNQFRSRPYTAELDRLHINTPMLLLGAILETDSASFSHIWYHKCWNFAKHIMAAANKEQYLTMIADMAKDKALDDNNRMVLLGVLINYASMQRSAATKKQCISTIKNIILTLPPYLAKQVKLSPSPD